MRVLASVTFENWRTAPKTARMTIDAPGLLTGASRVLKRARSEHPGVRRRSLVIVLERADQVEREGATDAVATAADEPGGRT